MQPRPFSLLAEVYDAIMSDVDYGAWAEFILDAALSAGTEVGSVLDLGCGTGNSSAPFAELGLPVTGLDLSGEMLSVAQQKLPGAAFVQGDFTDFDLKQTFDLVTSVFDSLNNLLNPEDFYRCAERAIAHLTPNGVFVFDVRSRSSLRTEPRAQYKVAIIVVEVAILKMFALLRVESHLPFTRVLLEDLSMSCLVFPVSGLRPRQTVVARSAALAASTQSLLMQQLA